MKIHAATQERLECIDKCERCHEECVQTLDYCLAKGGAHAEPSHLRLLMDCGQICQVTSDFLSRGSTYRADVCDVCADLCEGCAEACEAFGGDPQMEECARACRECAQGCFDVSENAG